MGKKAIKKIRPAGDAIEFLPDAMEIQQERLPWYCRIGVLWIFVIVASVLVWACLGEVDVIVRADGKIVSDRGDIVMKPLGSAVIKSIEVKEGDIVEAGQPLILFDPALNQAEVDRLNREIVALQAQFDRFESEFRNRPYLPTDPKEQNAVWQLTIYKQRQRYYEEKMRYFETNRNRLKSARSSTEASHKKYLEILENMSKIESMYVELQKTNVVAHKEVLEVAMSRMECEVEVDRLRNQLVDYELQLLSLESDKNSFVEEWWNSLSERMVSLSRELDGNRKMLSKAESLVSYVSLCSPCRAIVHDIASFPVGSAVGEAEAVITLVPLDGVLEIEAEVRPQDVSRVQCGSEARIKVSAYPFQKHGTLDGHVRLLSGNTFVRSGGQRESIPGIMPQTSYYRAHVTISGELRNVDQDYVLLPGMEAQVEIKSGRRRIIEYLIYPLIKGFDEAFKEP